MQIQLRLVILWLLCTIGMILHFNYHVSELFYGINVVRPDANGEVPLGVFIIRSVFYHLPFVWILLIMYYKTMFVKISLFITSILYSVAHLAHVIGELMKPKFDISQTALLFLVLATAIILTKEHFHYWKNNSTSQNK
ncbi:MAG: hypothetical protein AAF617_02425 [Bacteroidota bacterium]